MFSSPIQLWFLISSSGEAEAILARAKATAEALAFVSKALKDSGGVEVGSSIPSIQCRKFLNFCLYSNLCKLPILTHGAGLSWLKANFDTP